MKPSASASASTSAWVDSPPETLEDKIALIRQKRRLLRSPGRKGQILRSLLREVQQDLKQVQDQQTRRSPLSFFKPSYEQAIILNTWLYGIQFNAIYTANRIGKTTVSIVDKILWMFPNDPSFQIEGIFRPYHVGDESDPLNVDNPNAGKLVEVLPRPSVENIAIIAKTIDRLQLKPDPSLPHYDPKNASTITRLHQEIPHAFRPAFPYAPFNRGGKFWIGAPDHQHHKEKMMPLLRKYFPASSIIRDAPSDRQMTIEVKGQKRTTIWEITGLSYESSETKWASDAVEMILLTEGVPPEIMKEVKLRFTTPGFGSHDFTPYEAANVGAATALASRIYKGTEQLPLRTHVFTKLSVYSAPRHILPEEKQQGLIKAFKDDPQAKARLDGEFFTSSALILSNLSSQNELDWTIEEMFKRIPRGIIYRGLDPGYDHPTACSWMYLTPSNQWIIYRILSERGLGIPERCKKIVEFSNNSLVKVKWGKGKNDYYLAESNDQPNSEVVAQTLTDYHTFKEDETTKQPYANHYIVNGLQIHESVHMGPKDRAVTFDGMLKPSNYYPDLRNAPNPCKPPGPQVYFLINGPGVLQALQIWRELYWQRVRRGENAGEAKDEVPTHGDDELDACCYPACSPFRWTSHRPSPRIIPNSEPERSTVFASDTLNKKYSMAGFFGSKQEFEEEQGLDNCRQY